MGVELTHEQALVLRALDEEYMFEPFNFLPFAPIVERTCLDRKEVQRACRALASKGLATFEVGLWNDEGRPAGSGYGITKAGRDLVHEWPEDWEFNDGPSAPSERAEAIPSR